MTRWKITIEYNGAPFVGWQAQKDQLSVQTAIEDAIAKFSQEKIRIHAAGRTDAGVHATGQVAHFDLHRPMRAYDLAKAINAYLIPLPVAILKAEEVAPDFHARFMALNKLYRYKIINRRAPLGIDAGFAWHCKKELDTGAMHEAAQVLVGVHDYTTFRDTACQAKSPIRSIDRFDVVRDGEAITIEVEGKSFLHHQVRNMVGTLSHVGEGKWTPADVKAALEARHRTKGGVTCPPEGLYLARIDYPDT